MRLLLCSIAERESIEQAHFSLAKLSAEGTTPSRTRHDILPLSFFSKQDYKKQKKAPNGVHISVFVPLSRFRFRLQLFFGRIAFHYFAHCGKTPFFVHKSENVFWRENANILLI